MGVAQIDTNTDGLVDFMEFVAATLHVQQLEEHNNEKWQRLSKAAFEKFDVDRDGFITPEELKMVNTFFIYFKSINQRAKYLLIDLCWGFHFQHTGLRGSIYPVLEEADIDKDGKISLPEFRRLLRTASIS